MGVHVTLDDDQYSTDFGKAMRKIVGEQVGGPIKDVVVFGSLAGRVDQGIGLLHEMYREHLQHQDVRIWLYSETSMSFILPIGISKIQSKLSEGILTKKAGILPIYGPARITTTGFEWDVKDWSTAMGTQVSTSNHIIENEITVETDTPVLFTVQLDLSKNEVLPKDESFPT